MKYNFDKFVIIAHNETEKKAGKIFADEFRERNLPTPEIVEQSDSGAYVELIIEEESKNDDFEIIHDESKVVIKAHRLRGLIYGCGRFLRKIKVEGESINLIKNISGKYFPSMSIRGHQLSYTDMNNTYEAWDKKQFERYIKDLMFFGTNTIEASTTKDEDRTSLMKYSYKEALDMKSAICKELDLDFCVWHPLSSKLNDDETLEQMNEFYKGTPKLDIIFPPGGDPGDLPAEAFAERCRKMKNEIKKQFPEIRMHPSAQAPHQYADWGEKFVDNINRNHDGIDCVIYGPNHAMPLDELRRKVDSSYPLRFYPDIAHNVRCEVPVHFTRQDWHYSLTSTLSREAVNPRPTEYRLLHRITRQYVMGSVTYSEGVNDDVNKFVWSDMDFDFNCNTRETLEDYARMFFIGADSKTLADAIFGLEHNWNGDPAENPCIDYTFNLFENMLNSCPELENNWRFMLLFFRVHCDKFVRKKRLFETELISNAKILAQKGNEKQALEILNSPFTDEIASLRESLFPIAEKLNNLIGIQLDVEHFKGMNKERGCTLDTIDNPVTDRQWLINNAKKGTALTELFNRNRVEKDEYYFSFAEHGFEVCGEQEGEFYIDFCGDDNEDCELPMCMTSTYDHYNFKTKVAGLTGGDYKLIITYKSRPNDKIIHHKVSINSHVIHDGKQYGGTEDTEFEKKFLPAGYEAVAYDIDSSLLVNGCAELEITEPLRGFMITEFRFIKA